jgi:hypothetical protein
MPTQLQNIATVIRSKNAGPCLVTFDLMFKDQDDFMKARNAVPHIRSEVARLYGKSENEVRVIDYAPSNAVKITIPRDIISGDPGDRDVYGAQQHSLLLEIEI